jgi:multiple sugar transport system substrate-binding protein
MTQVSRQQCFRIAVRRYAPFERAIEEQWAAFERVAGSGLQLEIVALEVRELEHELLNSDGLKNGAWDVCFVNTDWVAALRSQRSVVDLAPGLASEPAPDWPEGWTPSMRRLQCIDGAVMGMPYHDGPECLILRKDLFEDALHRERFRARTGRDLTPPKTWEEFHELARFFSDPAQNLYGTAFAALPDGHNSVYDFLLQLWTRGGELFGADGAVSFDTDEAEAALGFYRAILGDRSAVHPLCREMDSVRLGQSFAAGELAMMVNWFGFATAAHADPESKVRNRVMVAPVPSSVGHPSVSLNVYWLLSIAAGSPHAETAWRFLRHVATPEMDRLTTLEGAIGCRRSTWNDEEVNRRIPFYRAMEVLHEQARELPRRRDWPEIAAEIDRLVIDTLATDRPVRELLRDAQSRFEGGARKA